MREPYPYMDKATCAGEGNPDSPDPLYICRWPGLSDKSGLELYIRRPVEFWSREPEAFRGVAISSGPQVPACPDTERLAPDSQVEIEVLGDGLLCMDFGVECAGWLEVDSDSPDLAGLITLGISEYNQPAFVNVGPLSPSKMARPKRYQRKSCCTYRLELNEELYEGARFGFLAVTGARAPFTISDIRLVCQVKPVHYRGSFLSDSSLLNRIWYTAAYTVRVNLREDYFAAILMDRGDRFSWTGDAYPAQAASLAAFANYGAVLQNLHYTASHSNGIESYEMYWIFSLEDYYRYTGDGLGVKGLLPEAVSRLEHAWEIFDTDCHLGFLGWDERLGAGFEHPETEENRFLYRCLAVRAWKGFASVLEELGEDAQAAKLRGWAAAKLPALKMQLAGLEGTGRSGRIAGKTGAAGTPVPGRGCGIHGAAEAILAGICEGEEAGRLWERYFQDRGRRLSLSPFNQYFLLQAMAAMGNYEEALCAVEDLWGGQLQHGATTFYETFRPQWNAFLQPHDPVPNNQAGYTSLAHPWSAGVLHWLQEEVLGIKPVLAGFRQFEVRPHPGSRLSRLSGKTPTPYGDIVFTWDWEKGECSLLTPEGTSGKLGLPRLGGDVRILSIEHTPPKGGDSEQAGRVSDEPGYLWLTCGPGLHKIRFAASGRRQIYVPEPFTYPMDFLGEDQSTCGNWRGIYGKAGYVLFNGMGDGEGTQVLPDYIECVTWQKAKQAVWKETAKKCCILQDFYASRAAIGMELGREDMEWPEFGGICTNDPVACGQTFTVDIQVTENIQMQKESGGPSLGRIEYTLSLYFADGDGNDRVSEVELYQLDTLELAAPPRLVKEYGKGKYLTYSCCGPARVRINQVRGKNAVLSAIFFA